VLFLGLVAHWLGLSAYRSIESFSPAQSILIFSPSFIGALAAFVLTPELPASGVVDLPNHYRKVAPWVFPLLALFVRVSGLSDRLIFNTDIILPLWFYILRSAVLLIPAFLSRATAHVAVLAFTVLAPVIFVALSAR
jgi:hypothetical protein